MFSHLREDWPWIVVPWIVVAIVSAIVVIALTNSQEPMFTYTM